MATGRPSSSSPGPAPRQPFRCSQPIPIDLLFKRAGVRVLGAPLVAALNLAGEGLDRAVPILREPVPGSLNANFHVEAVA